MKSGHFTEAPSKDHKALLVASKLERLRLQFGNFVEAVLFGGEVEAGHGGSPRAKAIRAKHAE